VNVTTLSNAELASELLAPTPRPESPNLPCACPEAPAYHPTATHHPELTHKLQVARELLLRHMQSKMLGSPIMNSPQVVKEWLCLYCAALEHEVFLILYLNAQHALIEAEELFRGTLTQTSVYPREVVKGALARNAAAVVLAHNHPSGNTEPSRADELLTQSLKSSLTLVDVRVLDHFIVGGDQVESFAERGLL